MEQLIQVINNGMVHYRFVPDFDSPDPTEFRGTFRLEKKSSSPTLRYLKISATREMLFQLGKTLKIRLYLPTIIYEITRRFDRGGKCYGCTSRNVCLGY